MTGYVPGEQPKAGERVVKLNTNEAAFGPSERVLEAIRNVSAEDLRRYPSPASDLFRAAVAERHKVKAEQVIAGNGSDDILTIVTRAYVPPGGRVAAPWPTYSLYPMLCAIQGAEFAPVDWGENWSLPVEALLKQKANAIYLANPNAPSGTFVPSEEIARLAERFEGLLLVDEAYADYAESDCVGLLADYENVIISRTLSKGYALAGLRLGYALAHPAVIEQLNKVRDSYNVDVIAQHAGAAALRDREHAQRLWQHVREERQRVTTALTDLGFDVLSSQANFVFARRKDAPELFAELKRRGVLVRWWDKPDLREFLRITIGTAQENTAVLAALKSLSTD